MILCRLMWINLIVNKHKHFALFLSNISSSNGFILNKDRVDFTKNSKNKSTSWYTKIEKKHNLKPRNPYLYTMKNKNNAIIMVKKMVSEQFYFIIQEN